MRQGSGQHASGVRQHVFPDHRERDLTARSIKHRQPHFRLEVLDLHGYGGCGEVEILRRAGEAQVPGDRGKDPKLAKGDILH
jgi:hypothetical protein